MNNYAIFTIALSMFIQSRCNAMEKPMKNNLSHTIVNEHHQPTPALLDILQATNIHHDGTLQSIYNETQKSWLRQAGKERWENQTVFNIEHDNPSELFKNLALVDEIKPSNNYYENVILLGSTVQGMRNRLGYLITLWNNGTRFNSINILAGQRPLDAKIETAELLLQHNCPLLPSKQNWQFNGQLPTTETEMIKMIFDQTELPADWNTITINFIDTPMQPTANGDLRRPNTLDTINEWIKLHNPTSGSILAISNQPYVGYQDAVLRNALPNQFTIETVGRDYGNHKKTATMLDTLARWIYNEYQMSKNAQ